MVNHRNRPRGPRPAVLVAAAAVAIAAGLAAQGWRLTVRFVAPTAVVSRPADAPVFVRFRPIRFPTIDGIGGVTQRSAPGPHGSAGSRRGAPPAGSVAAPAVSRGLASFGRPTPGSFAGLHLTFPREWPQSTYEIGAHPKPPVRFLCDACPAVNLALRRSPDTSTPAQKMLVNAASVGVITMLGGKINLVEWDLP